jgi:hypothetical protein
MSPSLPELMEGSFQIAWEYLERSGELGEHSRASLFLGSAIGRMIRNGTRSRLVLSNRAISAYRQFNQGTFQPRQCEMSHLQ